MRRDQTLEAPPSPPLPRASSLLDCPERFEGRRIGRFKVIALIGQGACGAVFRAHDPELDRQIALKFLTVASPGGTLDQQAYLRLLREAQALARVSHPNIVAIHDVGTFEKHVFLAMELVEGDTLRQWLNQAPRDPQDVLDVLIAAGRGLCAAHQAGLIHRDFKPDNIIIGNDGRVRVIDFGVARVDSEEDSPPPLNPGPCPLTSAGRLSNPITQRGAVVGTPIYMAPEQLRGDPVTPNCDQFSFCVTLYEGLVGAPPFDADDLQTLQARMTHGLSSSWGPHVPDWLRRAVMKGLAATPEARHASMHDLLNLLEKTPAQRRRKRTVIGAVVLAAAAAAVVAISPFEPAPCTQGDVRVADTLGDAPKHLKQAIFRTFGERAPAIAVKLDDRIQTYKNAWLNQYQIACRDTRVYREQDSEVMALRFACLQRDLYKTQNLMSVLTENVTQVDPLQTLDARLSSARLEDCADISALVSGEPPAPIRDQVHTFEAHLDTIENLEHTGRYRPALTQLDEMQPAVDALDHEPLKAQFRFRRASVLEQLSEYTQAEQQYLESADRAAQAQDALATAMAMTRLVTIVGSNLSQPKRGRTLARAAELSLKLAGNPRRERADLDAALGRLSADIDEYQTAEHHYKEALQYFQRHDPRHPQMGQVLNNLGLLYADLGSYASAESHFRAALQHFQHIYDEGHSEIGRVLANIGLILYYTNQQEEALTYYREALAIFESALEPDHEVMGSMHNNLAAAYREVEQFRSALEHSLKALKLREKTLPATHPNLALSYANTGVMYFSLEQYDEAKTYLKKALTLYEDGVGSDHRLALHAAANLGHIFQKLGECDLARSQVESVIAANNDGAWRHIAQALRTRGECFLQTGQTTAAIEDLERALILLQDHETADPILISVRFALAKALWTVPSRRNEAKTHAELAQQALSEQKNRSVSRGSRLGEIRRWLATR